MNAIRSESGAAPPARTAALNKGTRSMSGFPFGANKDATLPKRAVAPHSRAGRTREFVQTWTVMQNRMLNASAFFQKGCNCPHVDFLAQGARWASRARSPEARSSLSHVSRTRQGPGGRGDLCPRQRRPPPLGPAEPRQRPPRRISNLVPRGPSPRPGHPKSWARRPQSGAGPGPCRFDAKPRGDFAELN